KMAESENRIKQKETALNNKLQEVNKKDRDLHNLKANLSKQLEVAEAKQSELDKNHLKQVEMLEQVASMSKEDAKAQLVEVLKGEAQTEAMSYIKDVMDEAKINANNEARKIVI